MKNRRIPNHDHCPEVPVVIRWHHPRAFDNDDFAAVARFPNDGWPQVALSIVLSFDHTHDTSKPVQGFARFLVGDAPHDWLRPGATFEVMAGSKVVAEVTCLGGA